MNCRRNLRGPLWAMCGLVVLLIGSLASGSLQPATADIGDENAHLGFRVVREIEGVWITTWSGPEWITRNVVVGRPIPVCSADFPVATKEGVKRWNDALGVTVLKFHDDTNKCDKEPRGKWDPKEGIVSVTVTKGSLIERDAEDGKVEMLFKGTVLTTKACPSEGNDYHACAVIEFASQSKATDNEAWQSYHGRAEIPLNPNVYPSDSTTESPTRCKAMDDCYDYNLTELMAHELGHILALGDYFCLLRNPDGTLHRDHLAEGTRSLMNSWTKHHGCNAVGGKPTQLDKDDYRASYLPAKVTNVTHEVDGQTVTLEWDQSDVFVESGFEIQREDGGTWVEVDTVAANQTWAKLPAQPYGEQFYRIVSRTMALPASGTGHELAYADDDTASAKVSVRVRLPKPADLLVTAMSSSSLTLKWEKVVGADGYDVRYTTTASCEGAPNKPVTAPPHSFAGLEASTTYLLCVRATLAGTSEAKSEWASVTETTTSESSPPREIPKRPKDVITTEKVGEITEYEWRLYAEGIPGALPPDTPGACYWELYQRQRYALAKFKTTWEWDPILWEWVPKKIQIGLESDYIYTPWEHAGQPRVTCTSGSGTAGTATPRLLPAGLLLPGDYLTAWGGEWYRFTVPGGAEVQLRVRTVGKQEAMTFSLASGAEITVNPSQLTSDSALTDEPALSALAQSFRLEDDPTRLPSSAEQRICEESPERDAEGTLNLDLDAKWCVIVHGGGAVTAHSGSDQLALTLPSAQAWLVLAEPQSGMTDTVGIWLIEWESKSHLILDPATGVELSRRLTEGAEWLSAVLDAVVKSAKPVPPSN